MGAGVTVPTAATASRRLAPDPEVVAATARYAPLHPDIDRASFERVVGVAREALDGLAPVVVVNRRVDVALQALEAAPDALVPTIHTDTPPGLQGTARRTGRMVSERLHDTFGTGELQGRTVFGSTRFVDTSDARAGATAVLEALRRQGDVGVGAYGPVAMLLRPEAVAGRTTFAARDTALGMTRVTDASNLPQVVAERIARGVPGAPTAATLAAAASDDAVRRLRAWLMTDGLARRDGYIEAQVRGLRMADVAGIHVAQGYDGPVMRKLDPGPPPDASAAERLERAASRLAITLDERR